MIEERKSNGKFKNIIDFMKRVKSDVINKRQLEKLVQAGAFDSIENNRSKIFNNVSRFVELYGGEKMDNQNLLFEDREISFDDLNLFNQKFKEWDNLEILKNELEVIGFYFSDHPLNYFPEAFFELLEIKSLNEIVNNKDLNKSKLCGAILDIKERSNKDGKKYAFITVSEKDTQYELTIFSENLYKFRSILNEGNLIIFDIDIVRNNSENRLIIKNANILHKVFEEYKLKFTLFSDIENIIKYKEKIFKNNNLSSKFSLDLFVNIDNKLVNFDFNKYSIKSYKNLDDLKKSNLIDYSIEIT